MLCHSARKKIKKDKNKQNAFFKKIKIKIFHLKINSSWMKGYNKLKAALCIFLLELNVLVNLRKPFDQTLNLFSSVLIFFHGI